MPMNELLIVDLLRLLQQRAEPQLRTRTHTNGANDRGASIVLLRVVPNVELGAPLQPGAVIEVFKYIRHFSIDLLSISNKDTMTEDSRRCGM